MSTNQITSKKKLSTSTIQNLTILGILIFLCGVLALVSPKFLSGQSLLNILLQISYLLMACSATTMVIISGNIDLSIGGCAAMAGVVYALLAQVFAQWGLPTILAAFLAILCGTLLGLINGTLVSRFKMPSFIVTIATMYIARGIAYVGAGGAVISAGLPIDFVDIARISIGPITAPLIYGAIVFAVFLFIQNKTTLAKNAYAIGSNQTAAFLSGIKVSRTVTILYILSGTISAFAGVFMVSSYTNADCKILPTLELDVIIASVLGGTDINGGKGTILGVLISVLILGVLSYAMNLMNMKSYHQSIIKGAVLVIAILMHRLITSKVSKAS